MTHISGIENAVLGSKLLILHNTSFLCFFWLSHPFTFLINNLEKHERVSICASVSIT